LEAGARPTHGVLYGAIYIGLHGSLSRPWL